MYMNEQVVVEHFFPSKLLSLVMGTNSYHEVIEVNDDPSQSL